MGHSINHAPRLEAGAIAGRKTASLRGLGVTRSAKRNPPKHPMGQALSHRWGEAQHMSHHTCKVYVGTFKRSWGMEKHGAVVQLSAWRSRRTVGQFGPVLGPVVGPKIASADTGDVLDSRAPVRWYATGAPVVERLNGLPQLVSETLQGEPLDCGLKRRIGCHACSLHETCTLSTRSVSTYADTLGMGKKKEDLVWHRVNDELERRKAAHQVPSTWAALGAAFGATSQTTTNWKTRGVPPKEYQNIASALGWSIDELLHGIEPAAAPEQPASGLSPLKADLLAAFDVLPDDEQQELVRDVMAQAERYSKLVARELQKRGIQVTGFASATRTAEALPPAPPIGPHVAKKPRPVKTEGGSSKRISSPLSKPRDKRRAV